MIKSNREELNSLFIIDESFKFKWLKKREGEKIGVVYYSDDLLFLGQLKKICSANDIDLILFKHSEEINRIASSEKDEYIEFINGLGQSFGKNKKRTLEKYFFSKHLKVSLWWFSSVYEKNSTGFHSFHLYCFLRYLSGLISSIKTQRIYIRLKNRDQAKLIHEFIKNDIASVDVMPLRHNIKQVSLKRYFGMLYGAFVIFKRIALIQKVLGKREISFPLNNLYFIYYPFIDKHEAEQGQIISNYFKENQEELEKDKTLFIGSFVKDDFSEFKDFLHELQEGRNKDHHFLLEEFISRRRLLFFMGMMLFFQIKAVLLLWMAPPIFHRQINFRSLLREEYIRSFFSPKLLHALLVYNAVQTFRTKTIGNVYYIFENFGWERMLCQGTKQYLPDSRIIAYQHCPFGEFYLHFSHDRNLPCSLQPDRILSIGTFFKERLISFTWDPAIIMLNSPYRYLYLKQSVIKKFNDKSKSILILFSIDRQESLQFYLLLRVLLTSDLNREGYEIWFRTHPALPGEKFMDEIPPHWISKNKEALGDVLGATKIVIAGQGGVVLEALAHDCFVVQPVSNVKINLGILTEKDCSVLEPLSDKESLGSILNAHEEREFNKEKYFSTLFNFK